MGRLALHTEKYDEALSYWEKAREIDPQMPEIHQQMGQALLNLGRTREAFTVLQREIEIAPRSSEAHYLLGQVRFQRGDYLRAKEDYATALKLRPDHTMACYGLVKTCVRLGQKEEAAEYSAKFQQLKAADVQSNRDMRSQYDDLETLRDRLAVTCVDAGRVYYRHKEARQAEHLWQRAAAVDGTNAACRIALATLYREEGKKMDALRIYHQLVDIDPKNPSYYQQIGLLHAGMRNLASAESAFQKMLKCAPKQGEGYRMLAQLYLNTNQRLERARQLAATAVELQPVAASYFVLGWACAKTGDPDGARSALATAIKMEPGNATYRRLYQSIQKQK
jgi:tetratricopeptide (TPR) repeat protein